MENIETLLKSTPYSEPSLEGEVKRFKKLIEEAKALKGLAVKSQEKIAREGDEILRPYIKRIVSKLVSESNKIEGIDVGLREVEEIINLHYELLGDKVGNFVRGVRADRRVYSVLGLYEAHQVAREWVEEKDHFREYEVRQLHALIAAGEIYAGRYKSFNNAIGGSSLRTCEALDTSRAMREMLDWWEQSDVNPILEATILHAWFTHIHPFEDGNGRMARLLVNIVLSRSGYPPLEIEAVRDTGQYYDALRESDKGNILPLFDLFLGILKSTVKLMDKSGYVKSVAQGRLLADREHRYKIWKGRMDEFTRIFSEEVMSKGWRVKLQGTPSLASFAFLESFNEEGNSWYMKVFDNLNNSKWLLWHGFASDHMKSQYSAGGKWYPTILFSQRDELMTGGHPYKFRPEATNGIPGEIMICPLEWQDEAVVWRSGLTVKKMSLHNAAGDLADALVSYG